LITAGFEIGVADAGQHTVEVGRPAHALPEGLLALGGERAVERHPISGM
jgi:hypothetical protein